MDRRELLVGLLSGPLITTARGDAQLQGGPDPQRVADAERAFAASMAKRDLSTFAALIAEEAIFVGGGETPRVLRGRAAIVDGWKGFFDGPTAPFSWDPDIVEVLDSQTLALTSGPVRNPAGTITGRFNSIWRFERDGRWRVLFDRGCPVCATAR